MNVDALRGDLCALGAVLEDEPMSRHTTFGIGGPADFYLKVERREILLLAMRVASRHSLPCFVLGSGSNILVGDDGMRGLVIENDARSTDGPDVASDGRVRLRADSGTSFSSLARHTCRAGFWGLEWATGIPGSLGGAVVYNAGAYGGCLADVLSFVDVADGQGNAERLPAAALGLEYRGSLFTRGLFSDRLILSVDLRLRRGEAEEIMQRVTEIDSKRKTSQPAGRNAGSIFKNPVSRPAWWYIDQVGMRGARIGGAEISPKHANFFMNIGGARATDVKALMDEAARKVRDRFDVQLHPEVALVGDGFGGEGAAA